MMAFHQSREAYSFLPRYGAHAFPSRSASRRWDRGQQQQGGATTGPQQPPPPRTPGPAGPLPPTPTVAHIFDIKRWRHLPDETPPRLIETQPLSLFYHADENLTHAIRALKKVKNPSSDSFRRKCERVHRAQRDVLHAIHLVYAGMEEAFKADRAYRRRLPPEDQRELDVGFSENILFAAQALSKGFRIRGIEQFTPELVQPAKELCASMEAVKYRFRRAALTRPAVGSHETLWGVLSDFDTFWTAFEQKICFSYFSVTYSGKPSREDETDMFQVLMSETIIRGLEKKLLTHDQLLAFDPSIIVSLPRLTILNGLINMPDVVNMTDPESAFRWFRTKASLLRDLRDRLRALPPHDLTLLEQDLAGHEAERRTDLSERATELGAIYRNVCAVADEMSRLREFVGILQGVFKMHCEGKA
ncbi:hypothetical protein HDU96_006219 [Phlyctochytrium bullatum]|nr:hypothetical protein HDU96_006219 [Phlyctochytrium bullatum]